MMLSVTTSSKEIKRLWMNEKDQEMKKKIMYFQSAREMQESAETRKQHKNRLSEETILNTILKKIIRFTNL